MNKKIAFVTCSTKPLITEDDQQVVPILRERGIEVQAEAWDNPKVDWTQFDAIVLRSCWNYHYHPKEFREWIEKLERDRIKMINDSAIVKWNMHKSYLKDLRAEGVEMAKTIWIRKGSQANLSAIAKELNAKRIVVKPCVAATAYQTFLMDTTNLDQSKFDESVSSQDVMVQEFIEEIQTVGEWSLIFFDKEFSHAVIKKPKADDFRVQNDFGGSHSTEIPSQIILTQAKKILESIPHPLAYARVDGVQSGDTFLLMELELIEPALFIASSVSAAQRFALAIEDALI